MCRRPRRENCQVETLSLSAAAAIKISFIWALSIFHRNTRTTSLLQERSSLHPQQVMDVKNCLSPPVCHTLRWNSRALFILIALGSLKFNASSRIAQRIEQRFSFLRLDGYTQCNIRIIVFIVRKDRPISFGFASYVWKQHIFAISAPLTLTV